jgi:hypothetical protein
MWTDFKAEVDISVMEVEKVFRAIDEEDEIDAREENSEGLVELVTEGEFGSDGVVSEDDMNGGRLAWGVTRWEMNERKSNFTLEGITEDIDLRGDGVDGVAEMFDLAKAFLNAEGGRWESVVNVNVVERGDKGGDTVVKIFCFVV